MKPNNQKTAEEAFHARMEKLDRDSATVVIKNWRVPFYVVVKLGDPLPK